MKCPQMRYEIEIMDDCCEIRLRGLCDIKDELDKVFRTLKKKYRRRTNADIRINGDIGSCLGRNYSLGN